MWISEQLSREKSMPEMQTGLSTLNCNGKVEAVSTGAERDISIYSPYGYCFSLPPGVQMLLSKSDGQQAAMGTLMYDGDLKPGEIKITSLSGAYIHLKSDGSVVINGMKIDKNGVIADEG